MAPKGEKAWIRFEYPKPQTVRAVTLVLQGVPADEPPSAQELESSDDGQRFRTVIAIPASKSPSSTISFPEVTAKFFRVTFRTLPPAPAEPPPAANHQIAELVLHPDLRVNHFEEKAAFATTPDLSVFPTPPCDANDAVHKADVVDLTSKMRPDGTLDWTPPPDAGSSASRLFAPRHHQSSGLARSHGPRSGQAQPNLREELSRPLSGPVQGHRRPADGQARLAVRGHRQLGSRYRKLDRRHDCRIHKTARL